MHFGLIHHPSITLASSTVVAIFFCLYNNINLDFKYLFFVVSYPSRLRAVNSSALEKLIRTYFCVIFHIDLTSSINQKGPESSSIKSISCLTPINICVTYIPNSDTIVERIDRTTPPGATVVIFAFKPLYLCFV